MHKRIIITVLCIAGLFTACGKKDDKTTDTGSQTSSSVSDSAALPSESASQSDNAGGMDSGTEFNDPGRADGREIDMDGDGFIEGAADDLARGADDLVDDAARGADDIVHDIVPNETDTPTLTTE